MSEELFEDQVEATPPESLDDYMGEGKKYADGTAVAKALYEKDAFIKKLQQETQEMRTDLTSRLSLEEMIDQIAHKKDGEPPVPSRQEPAPSRSPEQQPDAPDLKEEVLRMLQEEKAKDKRQSNIDATRKALKERLGSNYNQHLEGIATELGVSKQFLTDMAATSPEGLMRLVDTVAKPSDARPSAPPASSVDTNKDRGLPSGRKNKAYYDEMRRTDKKNYLSKRIQSEMHKEAMEQGAKFYE